MTENDYHARLMVLEDWRISETQALRDIASKLDTLILASSKTTHCPKPGECIPLGDRLDELANDHGETMRRVAKLEAFRTFELGVIAAVGVLWAVVRVLLPMWMSRS